MSTHSVKNFKFTPLTKETLSQFKVPTSAILYDHSHERAAVLNKYNFTQEIIHSKDPRKEELIGKMEDEMPKISSRMQKLNKMVDVEKSKRTPNWKEVVKDLQEDVRLKYREHMKFETSIKDSKVKPLFPNSLDSESIEYLNDMGVESYIDIPIRIKNDLQDKYRDGQVSREEYEKSYNSLSMKHTILKLNPKLAEQIVGFWHEELQMIAKSVKYDSSIALALPEHTTISKNEYDKFKEAGNNLEKVIYKIDKLGKETRYSTGGFNLGEYKSFDQFLEKYDKKDFRRHILKTAAMMISLSVNQYKILYGDEVEKYKNSYSNEGTDNLWYRTIKGKTYISFDDILKLIESSSVQDNTKEVMKLLELGFYGLNDKQVHNHKRIVEYSFDLETKIAIDKQYKDIEFNTKQSDGRDRIGNNPKIMDCFDISRRIGIDKSKNNNNYELYKFLGDLENMLLSKFPGDIHEHINSQHYKGMADILAYRLRPQVSIGYLNHQEIIDTLYDKKKEQKIIDELNRKGFEWSESREGEAENVWKDKGALTQIGITALQKISRAMVKPIIEKLKSFKDYDTPGEILVEEMQDRFIKIFKKVKEKMLDYEYKIDSFIDEKGRLNPFIKPSFQNKVYSLDDSKVMDFLKKVSVIDRLNVAASMKDGGDSLSSMIEAETKLNIIVVKENKISETITKLNAERKKLSSNMTAIGSKLGELKVSNHVITNNIDQEKMLKMMETIVKMTMVGKNKDSIIDLTQSSGNIGKITDMLDDFNIVNSELFAMNYINDMNSLYKNKGLTENFERIEISQTAREMARGSNHLYITKQGVNLLGEVDRRDGKLKVYEGNHFPLFIDKETYSIFSLEWTGRFPTLQVSMMAPEFAQSVKTKSMEMFYESKGIADWKLKDKEYDSKIAEYVYEFFENVERESGRKQKNSPLYTKTYERIAEIFTLIQTNYFIQMGQSEEKALFLDTSSLNIEKDIKPNNGTVSFMNFIDQSMTTKIKGVQDYIQGVNSVGINILDRLTFGFETKNRVIDSSTAKSEGFAIGETKSKKDMQLIIDEVRDLSTKDTHNAADLIKSSIRYLYGESSMEGGDLPKNIKSLLDADIKDLRLFESSSELEKYKKEFESVMNSEFEFKQINR